MRFNKESFFKEFTKNQASFDEIHENILDGINIGGANFIILICAIIIASVGLNMNATAVIIGAMLISPLMGPILGIGYGVGTYNAKLIKKSLAILGLEIFISMVTSTIYFSLSPISSAGSEILSRTTPNIWDVIIAFTGGIAGIVGITRNKTGNVIPGVAIATALMPPLCTSGYGLASRNMDIFLGAGYLFFINAFFIALSTLIGVKLMKIPKRNNIDTVKEKKLKKVIIISTILVTIPSIFSAASMINESINNSNLSKFIQKEMSNDFILSKNIDTSTKTIDLVIVGNRISKEKEDELENNLKYYNFNDYRLRIQQDSNTLPDIQSYLDKLKEQNSGFIDDLEISKENSNKPSNDSKLEGNLTKALDSTKIDLYKNYKDIKKIYSGVLDNELPVIVIEYSSDNLNQEEVRNFIFSKENLKGTKIYFEKYKENEVTPDKTKNQ